MASGHRRQSGMKGIILYLALSSRYELFVLPQIPCCRSHFTPMCFYLLWLAAPGRLWDHSQNTECIHSFLLPKRVELMLLFLFEFSTALTKVNLFFNQEAAANKELSSGEVDSQREDSNPETLHSNVHVRYEIPFELLLSTCFNHFP